MELKSYIVQQMWFVGPGISVPVRVVVRAPDRSQAATGSLAPLETAIRSLFPDREMRGAPAAPMAVVLAD